MSYIPSEYHYSEVPVFSLQNWVLKTFRAGATFVFHMGDGIPGASLNV